MKRFLVEAALLALAAVVLHFTTGFPSSRQSFGGISPLLAMGILLVGTILGMTARYIFYIRGKFRWLSLVKPLVVSPIVLLPLIGSLQGQAALEPIQLVSFAFLSFQNGFFWKAVLDHADKN
ncbi:MAG TPA: hypothetical protein VIV57_27380 [Anaeromyxobacter sp.]